MIPVGARVRISRIRDTLLGDAISRRIGEVGVVRGLRVSDGYGLGYVVEFKDRHYSWFFEDELETIK
ncbi:cytochrome b6f subunit PetP [Anthocerotibacter panamensis]|uniref:cytochrome b6f subunit PetP n=1 Tax=Anthocerotibacter panamensis TaxID=2857077 RepID=UPI001C405F9E|nr:cytochrome b6f subunit family protein [Anthocerotibacter panamensis]